MDPDSRSAPRSRAVLLVTFLTAALLLVTGTVPFALAECVDNDGDGYGFPGDPSCPNGPAEDCDDTDGNVYPGAPEVCDGVNNDCDHPEWPSPAVEWSVSLVPTTSQSGTADLDGDGDLDVLSRAGGIVSWHENVGGIGWDWIEHVITAEGGTSLLSVDVDSDDDPDVVLDRGGVIRWYENTAGDGSAWIEHSVTASSNVSWSRPGDVDGDGDVDLVSVHLYEEGIAWYENTAGDGSAWIKHVVADYLSVGPVFLVNMDGDGDMDVLTWRNDIMDSVRWYENANGAGTSWIMHGITGHDNVYRVQAGDVDGDGDQDVLTVGQGDYGAPLVIWWSENLGGDGQAWNSHTIMSSEEIWLSSVVLGDLDDDDDLDVLSPTRWFENPHGTGPVWTEHVFLDSVEVNGSIEAADVDLDDDLDLLSSVNESGTLAWYENTAGDGTEMVEHVISTALSSSAIAAADMNDDGFVDVLSTDSGTPAWYYRDSPEADDDGDGLAECAGDCDDANPHCTTDCTDTDGDGFCVTHDCDDARPHCALDCTDDDADDFCLDLDCDDADPNNWWSCLGCVDADADAYFTGCDAYLTIGGPDCDDGNGEVHPGAPEICDGLNNDCDHPSWPVLTWWQKRAISMSASGIEAVHAADVDGDDDVDVLSAGSGKLQWYENAAADGSAWNAHVIVTTLYSFDSVFAADVDGDGDTDVLTTAEYGEIKIAWYENKSGDGSVWNEHVMSTTADEARTVFAVDMDDDDDIDVLTAYYGDDEVVWYENSFGNGLSWVEHSISFEANGPVSVFAADMDGDGDVDVLSASVHDDTVAWYENWFGDGLVWVYRPASTTANGARSVSAADVDGDDDTDLLWASFNDDMIAWCENDDGSGLGCIEHNISTSADGAWSVFAADVDADGDLDVLSASFSDDTIAWYENSAGSGSTWIDHPISTSVDQATAVFAADLDGDGVDDVLSASSGDQEIAWYRLLGSLEGDLDGDGLAECAGDCDDGNPASYPGAPEANDGVDNQCPGDAGHGLIDEIEGQCGFHDPENRDEYSWPAQPGATSYEVARFPDADNPLGCMIFTTADTSVIDSEEPPAGSVFHYLVRALAPHAGSWGADSSGVERTDVCP